MDNEKILLKTENGRLVEAAVVSKQPDAIWVALGEGIHNVRCKLVPTRNGVAYVGTVMGRELVYERSVSQVKMDLTRCSHEPVHYRRR